MTKKVSEAVEGTNQAASVAPEGVGANVAAPKSASSRAASKKAAADAKNGMKVAARDDASDEETADENVVADAPMSQNDAVLTVAMVDSSDVAAAAGGEMASADGGDQDSSGAGSSTTAAASSGGGNTALYILGGAALIGGGVAAASSGGSNPPPPPPPPPPPSYSIVASNGVTALNEGDTVAFRVTGANARAGDTVSYTVEGINQNDLTSGSITGSVVLDANLQATVSFTLANDRVTEGAETLTVRLSGGSSAAVRVNDTSIAPVPTYTLERDAASINEDGTVTFKLTTTNVAAGTVFNWAITGGVNAADVVGGQTAGTAVIGDDGVARVQVKLAADRLTEGAETLNFAFTNIPGGLAPVSVTVNDTSLTPTFDLTADRVATDEGTTIKYTLKTTNVDAGETFGYVLTGLQAEDIEGGLLTGTFVINSDGLGIVEITIRNDALTEGAATLKMTVPGTDEVFDVVINDTSRDNDLIFTAGLDDFTGPRAGTFDDNILKGSVASSFLLTGTQTTFGQGDQADAGGGRNTLQLFMDPGATADGVELKNVQVLDLRLNAQLLNIAETLVVMTDWDDSLEEINIRSNKSNLTIIEQKTLATVSIDDIGIFNQSSSYSFFYAEGVLDGDSDRLDLTVRNVNGFEGSDVTLDDGLEAVTINVNDPTNLARASVINLEGFGLNEVDVEGGRAGAPFTLSVLTSGGTDFDSTTFAGDMVLDSNTILTARLGVGDDTVSVGGDASDADSSYDLGAGDNSITVRGALGGDVTAGDGDDSAVAGSTTAGAVATIDLAGLKADDEVTVTVTFETAQGTKTLEVEFVVPEGNAQVVRNALVAAINASDIGDIFNATNDNGDALVVLTSGLRLPELTVTVSAGEAEIVSQFSSLIDLANGDNVVGVTGNHAGVISVGTGDDVISAGTTSLGSLIDAGEGENTIVVGTVGEIASDSSVTIEGDDHDGDIVAGSGNDTIVVGNTGLHSSINAGDGDNRIVVGAVTTNLETGENVFDGATHLGQILAGDGDDLLQAGRTGEESLINLGDGDNAVVIGVGTDNEGVVHAGELITGSGDDTVVIGDDEGEDGNVILTGGINVGDGDNTVGVLGSASGASIVAGDGVNAVEVAEDVINSTVSFGDGDGNSLTIGDDLLGGSDGAGVSFGDGDDNSLTVGDDIEDETVAFGAGEGATITVEDSVERSSITVEGDSTTFSIGDDVDASTIDLGNGSNVGFIGDNVTDGSQISFGSGADELTIGDGDNDPVVNGVDVATNISMGGGADQVTMVAGGEDFILNAGEEVDPLVASGGFIDGGRGNDTFTVRTEQSQEVIHRTEVQEVSIAFFRSDVASFLVGDLVTVSFERGGEIVTIDYTVVAADIVQGDGAATSENVANKVADLINAEADLDMTATVVLSGSGDELAVDLELAGNVPFEDFDISAVFGDEEVELPVTVQQISDTRITDFENIELVAVNNPEFGQNITINADFELINGAENVLLDSQVERKPLVEEFDNMAWTMDVASDAEADVGESLANGKYNSWQQGGPVTFELENLAGGEAITVRGHESTATGRRQVSRINVDDMEGAHDIGDVITVTIGETVITYTIVAGDLSGGESGGVDANRIAAKLAAAINAQTAVHGVTAVVDVNAEVEDVTDAFEGDATATSNLPGAFASLPFPTGAWVTLTTAPGVDAGPISLTHTEAEPGTEVVVAEFTDTEWDVKHAAGVFSVGDTITITIGEGDDEETFTLTLTEDDLTSDCTRIDAEVVAARIVAAVGGDAATHWGVVDFGAEATIEVTREVPVLIDSETLVVALQEATDTDDGNADVVIDAFLAEGAENTTMDLTVLGYGNFDVAVVGNSDADTSFTDLQLTLSDEFSHTIDLGGDTYSVSLLSGVQGNFSNSVVVADGAGIDTDGQSVELTSVLARDVDTTDAEADFVIDQYNGVRDDRPADFAGESITVATGRGDDHLLTLAQSAIDSESSINLGTGSNTLSLGWGSASDDIIDSTDVEEIGEIDYSGDLTTLNILNDVRLTQDATTLTMPGGVDSVDNLNVSSVNGTGIVTQTFTIAPTTDTDFVYDVTLADGREYRVLVDLTAEFDEGKIVLQKLVDGEYVEVELDTTDQESVEASVAEEFGVLSVSLADGLDFLTVTSRSVFLPITGVDQVELASDGEVSEATPVNFDTEFEFADDNDLTIVGMANDATITAGEDFALSVTGVFGSEDLGTLTIQDADGDQTTGSITVTAGEDVAFALGNDVVTDLSVETGGSQRIHIEEGDGRSVQVDTVSMVSGGFRNSLVIGENVDSDVTLGSVDMTVGAGEDFPVSLNTLLIEDNVSSEVNVGLEGDISLSSQGFVTETVLGIGGNSDTEINLGAVDIKALNSDLLVQRVILATPEPEAVITYEFVTLSGATYRVLFDPTKTFEQGRIVFQEKVDGAFETVDIDTSSEGAVEASIAQALGIVAVDFSDSSDELTLIAREPFDKLVSVQQLVFGGDNTVDSSIPQTVTSGEDLGFAGAVFAVSANESDTDVNVEGPVSIYADDFAVLDISDNFRTNVDMAADGTISVVSCGEDAGIVVTGNVNDWPSSVDMPQGRDYTIALGDMVVDAGGSDALFDVSDNSDTALFGDMIVTTGDLTISSYVDVEIDMNANRSTTVNVGNIDAKGRDDVFIDIDNNTGRIDRISSTTNSVTTTVTLIDSTDITIGNISATASGDDVRMSVNDNSLTNVVIGDVTLVADDDVKFGGEDNFTPVGESDGVTSIEIGMVDITAGDDVSFYLSDNQTNGSDSSLTISVGQVDIEADEDVDFEIASNNTSDSGSTLDITVGDVDIGSGEDVDFRIKNQDAEGFGSDSGISVTVGTVDITAEDTVDFYIRSNDADAVGGSDASTSVTVGDVTVDDGSSIDFDIDDNDVESWGGAVDITVGVVDLTADTRVTVDIRDNDAEVDLYTNGSDGDVTITVGNVTAAGGTAAEMFIENNDAEANLSTVTIDVGDVVLSTSDDEVAPTVPIGDIASFGITGNDASGSDSDLDVDVGSVTITTPGFAEFYITNNDVTGTDAEATIDVGDVSLTAGSDALFDLTDNYGIAGEDTALEITVGDVGVSADRDARVEVGATALTMSTGFNTGATVELGDVTVAAGLDAFVFFEGQGTIGTDTSLSDGDSNFGLELADFGLTVGDIGVTAGNDADTAGSDDVSSQIDFLLSNAYGAEVVELTAKSANEGTGDVTAIVRDAYDLGSFTVTADTATITMSGVIGGEQAATGPLSNSVLLDFSGVSETLNVNNVDADFTEVAVGGIVRVVFGSADVVYNAQDLDPSGAEDWDSLGEDADDRNGDGIGQIASEVFTFTGDTFGDVVIGGFNAAGFGTVSPDNTRPTDRLDFSNFDWTGDGVVDGDDAVVDASYFNIEVDGRDILITFKGGQGVADDAERFGSIRLVGAADLDNLEVFDGVTNASTDVVTVGAETDPLDGTIFAARLASLIGYIEDSVTFA